MKLQLKKLALTVLIINLNCHNSFSALSPEEQYQATQQRIYDKTYSICQNNSWKSAVRLGFSGSQFISSTTAWLTFSTTNEIQKLNQSPAYWQAINDCYNYKSTLSGNLKKQLIDMGFLSTQVSSYMIGLAAMLTSAKLYFQATTAVPKVTAAFTSYQIANILAQTCKSVSSEFSSKSLSPQEAEHLKEIENTMFSDTNELILEAKRLATLTLKKLYQDLQNNPSENRREQILAKIKSIEAHLKQFDQIEIDSRDSQDRQNKIPLSEKYNICSPNFMKEVLQ